MAREINLVPDVKDEMIKALKLRNLILFICIVVASSSIGVIMIFLSIAGGQQAIVNAKKDTLSSLSSKVNGYEDLSDYLTIKDQLGNVSAIASNKKLLSRTFGILTALLPNGLDTITLSELSINLVDEEPTISFDAQANAGTEPYIDYNVLDSFKKSMQYMKYDYGNYVDRYNAEIPAYCMIEIGTDGSTFYDYGKQSYYAYWLIDGDGCNPSYEEEVEEEFDEDEENSSTSSSSDATEASHEGYEIEDYMGNNVVKIWRTPQFSEWYKEDPEEDEPYMDISGDIENIAHFNSSCITYSGVENEDGTISWGSSNEECLLIPNGIDGIAITDSSNGRGASNELVLRFSAIITLSSEAFSFNNHHFLAIAPSGKRNVTDSYVQIQSMFAERAADCQPGDADCANTINVNGTAGE